jgi:hypothetical protein
LLQASYVSAAPEQKAAYRQCAKESLSLQARADNSTVEVTLEEVERQFREELAEAETWYNDVAAKEASWIAAGLNPEVEFATHYAEPPSQSERESIVVRTGQSREQVYELMAFTLLCVVLSIGAIFVLFCFLLIKAIRARRGQTTTVQNDDSLD